MRLRASLLGSAVAVGLAVLGAVSPVAGAVTGQAQAPLDRLQVWNVNTHGMATDGATCSESPCTDYREFVDYITDPSRVAYVPDIVTLQEAGTNITGLQNPSCTHFVTAVEARTGLDYNCYETTQRGGAAIVYRTGRLSYVGGTFRSVQLYEIDTTTNACAPSSWYALALRLKDDLNANHFVNVASVHLPTRDGTSGGSVSDDCAWDNMKLLSPVLDGLGSAGMKVMAGDWNHADATTDSAGNFSYWECEYAGTNVDVGQCGGQNLGWKDAMYRACGLTGSAAYTCLHTNHWTHGSSHARIDFLFAKTYAIYNQVTVDWAAAYASAGSPSGGARQYSDHRGQGALLRYY